MGWSVWLFGLCMLINGIVCRNMPINNRNNSTLLLHWLPNTEGLFSQFLQLKVMYYFARINHRQLVSSPFTSPHFKSPINLCDVFELPSIMCSRQEYICIHHKLLISEPVWCINRNMPTMGGETRRDSFLHAVKMTQPSFIIHGSFSISINQFLVNLGVTNSKQPFTVIHWRRGDQIKSRCHQSKDSSVNCGNATDLIAAVRRHTKDSIVYVATNEESNSAEMKVLINAGFKTFNSGLSNKLTIEPNSITAVMIDAALMLRSTTLLAWGVSIINDVIEHQRMLDNRTYCTGYSDDTAMYPTWCWLHHQELKAQNKRIVSKSQKVDGIPFIVLSMMNTSHMTAYEAERAGGHYVGAPITPIA